MRLFFKVLGLLALIAAIRKGPRGVATYMVRRKIRSEARRIR